MTIEDGLDLKIADAGDRTKPHSTLPAHAGTGPFKAVVSLGGWCQVAWQLRRLRLATATGPFDHTGTTFDSLLDVLSHGAVDLGRSATADPRRPSVTYCDRYGLEMQHEFRLDDEGRAEITEASLRTCARRFVMRWRSFSKACEGGDPLLFIRLGSFGDARSGWAYQPETRPMTGSDFNRLPSLIRSLYPRLPFAMVWLYHPEIMPVDLSDLDPCVQAVGLPTPAMEGITPRWSGDDAEWDRLAQELSLPAAETGYRYWW